MDEDSLPAHPFAGGPYFFVAVPEPLEAAVPVNHSSFLREWTEQLDPVGVIADAARDLLHERWSLDKWFAVQPFTAIEWLRLASRDSRLVEAFEAGEGGIISSDGRRPLRELVKADDVALRYESHPVLLGLVTASCILGTGFAGHWLDERASDLTNYLELRRAERAARTNYQEVLDDRGTTKELRQEARGYLEEYRAEAESILKRLRDPEAG